MVKTNHSLKSGGGNLLNVDVVNVLADDTRLFHCGEVKLSPCHSELVSESLTKRLGNFPSPREEGVGERVLPFAKIKSFTCIIKKCAFTLTEVLIAVAIVGVIAVIVLPMVVTNYQKNMLNHQYKREVQSINNAVNDLPIGENKTSFFSTMMYYDSEPSSYEENAGLFLKKYFKVARYCGENNGNCFAPAYYTYEDNMRKVYTPEYKGACAQLKNGMSICITPQVGNLGVHGLLDLNGKKGPNVLGEDLRDFIIDPLERSAINRETSEVYYEDYLVPTKDPEPENPPTPPTPPTPSNPCTVNPSSLDCCKTKKITSPFDKCCTYTEIKDSTPACIDKTATITYQCSSNFTIPSGNCNFNARGYEADYYYLFFHPYGSSSAHGKKHYNFNYCLIHNADAYRCSNLYSNFSSSHRCGLCNSDTDLYKCSGTGYCELLKTIKTHGGTVYSFVFKS